MNNPLSAQVGDTNVRLEHSPDFGLLRIHVTDSDAEGDPSSPEPRGILNMRPA